MVLDAFALHREMNGLALQATQEGLMLVVLGRSPSNRGLPGTLAVGDRGHRILLCALVIALG